MTTNNLMKYKKHLSAVMTFKLLDILLDFSFTDRLLFI